VSRVSRLLELMELLRRRRSPILAEQLAEGLGISVRTVYRDIVTLQAQGAEIVGEPGVGYVLRPGFTLPPLMFSADELEALVLGSRWVEVRGDERLSAAATGALSKIRSVLPRQLHERVDEAILTVPDFGGAVPRVDTAELRKALRAEHVIELQYRDQTGKATTRRVWPFLIGFFEHVEVLAAWCELRGDFRAFRLDRIGAATDTGQRYPRRRAALVREWRQGQAGPPADEVGAHGKTKPVGPKRTADRN